MGKHAHWFISLGLIAACLVIGVLSRGAMPTLKLALTEELTVEPGKELSVPFELKQHVNYLVLLSGQTDENEQALTDGYLKITQEGEILPSMEVHESNLADGAPSAFVTASEDSKVNILVGSDIADQGGVITLNVYDASHVTTPILSLELIDADKDGADATGRHICVRRVGNLQEASEYRIALSEAEEELTIAMSKGDNHECAPAPVETGTATFAKDSVADESLANAKSLGLKTEIALDPSAETPKAAH